MKWIATLGPIGYLPASGTCATLATLLMIHCLHLLHISWFTYGLILVVCLLGGLYAIQQTHKQFASRDPREIVIDEVVGCFCTFLFIPWTVQTALLGFLLFRFFDITKSCGIRFLERPAGALGIMLDDVGAGIISNIILHGVLWFST